MMVKTGKRLTLCEILLTGILIFIWGNSAMPGQTSGALSGWAGALLSKILPFLATENGLHFLRKAAHFSEFAALGMTFSWLFGMLMANPLPKYGLPLLCGAAAACIDEAIQIFSPGRYCSPADVALDCAGVATGFCMVYLAYRLIRILKQNTTK